MRYFFLLVFIMFTSPLFSQTIVITRDTTINNVWDVMGKTLRFEGGRIKGRGTLKGGIIDAGLRQWIFDTTLTVDPEGTYGQDFSAMWFGTNSKTSDNYNALQTSINTCIRNNLPSLFIPKGNYSYSKSLVIGKLRNGDDVFSTLHLYGEGSFWGGGGTQLRYTATNGPAINLQLNKGSEINNIQLSGRFKSPAGPDSVYYKIPFEKFVDVNGKCEDSRYTPHSGIAIDYYKPVKKNTNGSTGIKIHDVFVGSFVVNICVSPNGDTRNAEILLFENIHIGDGKVGFATGQAQEKDNEIRQVFSWGRLHTLFVTTVYGARQPGNWYINGGNIAGKPIRLIYNNQTGWYNTIIDGLFCESLGSIGTITTQISTQVSNCTFHFADPAKVGYNTLFTGNSRFIKFNTCLFRYYNNQKQDMHFAGTATFDNCTFSGQPLFTKGTPRFINSNINNKRLHSAEEQ